MDLSLVDLSRAALVAGIDVGFNGAEIERFVDSETLGLKMVATFGDGMQMRNPRRLRTPSEWAFSYSDESTCSREPRQIEVPIALIGSPISEVRAYFIEQLLEVA